MIGEGENSFLELQGFRDILGIVNNDVLPRCLHQPKIAGSRLRAGFPIRNGYDPEMWRERETPYRVARFEIVFFREEENLQFLHRIVQRLHRLDKLWDDRG